jgi:predicted GNAT family acetyltransferase
MSEVRDNVQAGRFEIAFDDGEVAFAAYQIEGDSIVFPHTVVPEQYEEQGIASRLAEAALASTRARGLKVVPRCSFFANYMRTHPETHDLLASGTDGLLEG